ncbi:DUF4393 domain-containing protein [Spirulina major CS-329]|uniref:DUF4393 domain-containing protein n=1 Tax=Spirulina TaxID=1154 RepID=UPI00232B6FE3|nr:MULTISPECIES: DUF4393 domain-containing protein [Spirulina]MDB9494847.1 DUF4393 domain-containing protein [Spirulina subsalsa CS-330]MDB9501712.1 DUF4393 domain-containing protein [Spirulina major CS-329]
MDEEPDVAKYLLLSEVYKDTLQPTAKQIGGGLESTIKVLRLLIAPIERLAIESDRWQHHLKKLSDRVPEEQRIEAHPQIVGPVFEALRYVDESSVLAEMFINLLARAIDRERVREAHPAFPKIIAQLSVDEAHILFWLKKDFYIYRQCSSLDHQSQTFKSIKLLENSFPLNQLIYPENFEIYLDHLHSLNLAGIWQVGNQEPIFDKARNIQTGVHIKSHIKLTRFGELFTQACVPNEISS